jgi:hypothetical protein
LAKKSSHLVISACWWQGQIDGAALAGADASLFSLTNKEWKLLPIGLIQVDADVQHLSMSSQCMYIDTHSAIELTGSCLLLYIGS